MTISSIAISTCYLLLRSCKTTSSLTELPPHSILATSERQARQSGIPCPELISLGTLQTNTSVAASTVGQLGIFYGWPNISKNVLIWMLQMESLRFGTMRAILIHFYTTIIRPLESSVRNFAIRKAVTAATLI